MVHKKHRKLQHWNYCNFINYIYIMIKISTLWFPHVSMIHIIFHEAWANGQFYRDILCGEIIDMKYGEWEIPISIFYTIFYIFWPTHNP